MNYSENLVPITDLDRAYLKKQTKQAIGAISIIFIVFWGLAATFCIYDGDWYIFYFVGAFSLIFLFIGIYIYRRASFYTRPDAKKWVIEGEIFEKREDTTIRENDGKQDMDTDYYLVFANREVKVSYSNYRKYNAGDIIRIELTESSNILLDLTPITIQEPKEIPVETDYLSGYNETMEDGERAIIKKTLLKRSIIVLVVLAVIYFITLILTAILIAEYFQNSGEVGRHFLIYGRYYLIAIIGVGLYALVIRKLLSDFLSNLKKVTLCTINDKIHSNVKLLGRNIKTSIRGDYHYILTAKKLYQIPTEEYHQIDVGKKVKIHEGNKSGLFLKVEIR
ncbi:MAG: hypothetical protein HOO91_13065 [Bacteroidales bacterium]|nr:hypothetical protein [Bacteroidales bacterium]